MSFFASYKSTSERFADKRFLPEFYQQLKRVGLRQVGDEQAMAIGSYRQPRLNYNF